MLYLAPGSADSIMPRTPEFRGICDLGLTYSRASSPQIMHNLLCTNILGRDNNVTPTHIRFVGCVLQGEFGV